MSGLHFRKKASFSSFISELPDLEDPPNNLKKLEVNISEGATKNLFGSTKETISNESLAFLEDITTENTKTLSNQEYFSKKISLKFLESKEKREREEFTIKILPSEENAKIQAETIVISPRKVFFSFETESPRKKNNIMRNSSPIGIKIGWRNHEFKNILFDRDQSDETFYNHLVLTYKGLVYGKEFLRQPSENLLKRRLVKLLSSDLKAKTLFFDLDNTLISKSYKGNAADICFNRFNEKGDCLQVFLGLRPYALETLSILAKYYEIYIFTSATKEYAEKIMNILDPEANIFNGALHRSHCFLTKKGFYIKDLRIITNKNLNDMLIIDNLSHSFAFQIDNGIPILPWYNDSNDCELRYLARYLIKIAKCNNLREANKQYLRLAELGKKKLSEIMQ